MRVVVADGLELRAGQAFNDDGSINTANGDITPANYVEYGTNSTFFDLSSDPEPQGFVDIGRDNLPVATVNRRDQNVNQDVKIQIATNVNTTSVTFNHILEIENNRTDPVNVGISYDRDGQTRPGAGQYGDDVNVGGSTAGEITEQTVQHMYRFIGFGTGTFGSGRISPNQSDTSDDPANVAKIDPGTTMPIDLKVDLSALFSFINVQNQIEDAATLSGGPFQERRDTADLLNEITVGVEDPNNQF